MARVEKTPRAKSDAIDIWLYIAEEDPAAADKVLRRIDERVHLLAEMPTSGESVEFISKGVRRTSVGRYVVYYRQITNGIEIVRILHGARRADDLVE
ncbi:type II toxin-antitoxin system RelE/ParE family toxin [Calycomorphotria hydatis]|uniref:Toxin ParE1 n=1 Tax=Calycomorphotria hydatis TaxID=2528027 RepID=A0A517T4I0_9PLAN|nr:type II toxin-antitoxin system RelE/ParE family toxin [Calycomorphotria hydatis]QDT63280.1 Toxin ParE1 [Calycomorphotria hydatis]